jgi:hypothetical protein
LKIISATLTLTGRTSASNRKARVSRSSPEDRRGGTQYNGPTFRRQRDVDHDSPPTTYEEVFQEFVQALAQQRLMNVHMEREDYTYRVNLLQVVYIQELKY